MRVGRGPNHFDVIASGQLQHKVDGHQAIAINAAMTLLNAKARVAVRHVTRAAAVVLTQPDVHVMDLRVGVHKLNGERQTVDASICKGDAAARSNADPIIVGVGAVDAN